jgi:hypothetical protein
VNVGGGSIVGEKIGFATRRVGVGDAPSVGLCAGVAENIAAMAVAGIVLVGAGRIAEKASRVSAATVFMLETNESTNPAGCAGFGVGTDGSRNATTETAQNRLIPIAPASKTTSKPAYSRGFA